MPGSWLIGPPRLERRNPRTTTRPARPSWTASRERCSCSTAASPPAGILARVHADTLFWHTLEDLRRRVESARAALFRARTTADDYNVVMISALLRKLLLDGQSLTERANREHRVRIRYQVHGWPMVSGSAVQESRVHLYSAARPGVMVPMVPLPPPRALTRDQMLGEVVLVWNGVDYSAKSLIAHVAHVEGGVHVGSPNPGVSAALKDLATRVSYDEFAFALRGLIEVAGVVIGGLDPLRRAVEAGDHPPTDDRQGSSGLESPLTHTSCSGENPPFGRRGVRSR
jgi:hypothetical protein